MLMLDSMFDDNKAEFQDSFAPASILNPGPDT